MRLCESTDAVAKRKTRNCLETWERPMSGQVVSWLLLSLSGDGSKRRPYGLLCKDWIRIRALLCMFPF